MSPSASAKSGHGQRHLIGLLVLIAIVSIAAGKVEKQKDKTVKEQGKPVEAQPQEKPGKQHDKPAKQPGKKMYSAAQQGRYKKCDSDGLSDEKIDFILFNSFFGETVELRIR